MSLAGLALLGAFWLGRTSAPVAPAVPPPPASEITAPEQPAGLDADGAELEAERARSRELAAQVAWLQNLLTQLAGLGQEAASPPPAAGGETAAAEASTAAAAIPGPGRTQPHDWMRWFDRSEFDALELLESGVPPSEVERLRELFDAIEMERIELMRQALREGWLTERRYRDEMVEFDREMREKIGDDSYDAMLYATGRDNRVRIRELLPNHPADKSFGLELGDVLLRYDGRLIFRAPELREASRLGEAGEWVSVDVLRNGEILHLRGQRGRIGARLEPARILPGAFW